VRTKEMRDELNEANKRVTFMKNDVRSAERDLSESEQDKDAMRKSLACNVSKIESLIGSARSMRAHRATMKESINVLRRKKKEREEVYVSFTFVCPVSF
jgi:hypothetical protein